MWVPLKCPLLGTWPATQACALTGNQSGDPLVYRLVLNPLGHSSQGFFHNLKSFKMREIDKDKPKIWFYFPSRDIHYQPCAVYPPSLLYIHLFFLNHFVYSFKFPLYRRWRKSRQADWVVTAGPQLSKHQAACPLRQCHVHLWPLQKPDVASALRTVIILQFPVSVRFKVQNLRTAVGNTHHNVIWFQQNCLRAVEPILHPSHLGDGTRFLFLRVTTLLLLSDCLGKYATISE